MLKIEESKRVGIKRIAYELAEHSRRLAAYTPEGLVYWFRGCVKGGMGYRNVALAAIWQCGFKRVPGQYSAREFPYYGYRNGGSNMIKVCRNCNLPIFFFVHSNGKTGIGLKEELECSLDCMMPGTTLVLL